MTFSEQDNKPSKLVNKITKKLTKKLINFKASISTGK